jgi:arylsulfatase A-like enzyme
VIEDYKSRPCDRETFSSAEWSFLNGTDDECTADSLLRFAAPDRGAEKHPPFFAVLWTMMTHYPYFVSGAQVDYHTPEPTQNRYLNALRQGDRALGKLMRALRDKGLSESTLVIVVGDHGEAFGRHDQFTHASKVYEENVHIPLMLINPVLFHGEQYDTIGGLVDIAPTVMEILGIANPGSWQGQSLFAPDRSGRVYFFAPWSDYLFGYREGDRKYIYNATTGQRELFDLSADPQERQNLISGDPEAAKAGQQRLAAWVQFQNQFYKQVP